MALHPECRSRLTDDERQTPINLLTVEIEASKFPLPPRIESSKRVRAKLAGESATPAPASRPSHVSHELRPAPPASLKNFLQTGSSLNGC